MKKIKVSRSKIKPAVLKEVVSLLKQGRIIIYPTETAYGIGGDALNQAVIRRVFALKRRSDKKPLPVIVGSFLQAQKIAVFEFESKKMAKKYWPGPLTLVLKKKKKIPSSLTAGKNKIAVRVPGSQLARTIASQLNRPLISTSANVAGKGECYTVAEILKQSNQIEKGVDLILDAGKLSKVKPSTVIEIKKGEMKILRKGPITFSS